VNLAVFDIDGTLTKTQGLCDGPFVAAIRSVVGADVETDWSLYPDVTDSGITHAIFDRALGRGPTEEELRRVRTHYLAAIDAADIRAHAMPGAPTVLRRVAEQGWAVAIATGNWAPAAQRKLRWCGIEWDGVPMATADDAKGRADILRTAIARAGPARRVVYLGDAPWDQAAARAAGTGFVRVGPKVFPAEHSIPHYEDLEAVLAAVDSAAHRHRA
jgi:phosphoglycolate phosphatase-like HAD superfamily hydrolase